MVKMCPDNDILALVNLSRSVHKPDDIVSDSTAFRPERLYIAFLRTAFAYGIKTGLAEPAFNEKSSLGPASRACCPPVAEAVRKKGNLPLELCFPHHVSCRETLRLCADADEKQPDKSGCRR